MFKLTPEQRFQLTSAVSRVNTEKMIMALEESGPLSEEEKNTIELCSAVSASAISLALKYFYELYEEYH